MKSLTIVALAAVTGTQIYAGIFNTNLIVNGDAESGAASTTGNDVLAVPGWTTANGFTVTLYGAASGIPTNCPGPSVRGSNLFTGGPGTALSAAYQAIDLSFAAARVDSGLVFAELTGYLGGWQSQNDNAVLKADFTDGISTNILKTMNIGPVTAVDRTNQVAVLFRGKTNAVPAGARQVTITLIMTRTDGSYNDGYADNVSFVLNTNLPVLTIQNGATFGVSWPASAGSWQLQSATNLTASQWTNVAPPYQTNAGQIQYPDAVTNSSRFYRLQLP